jgi:hypothetical protein
MALEKHGLLLRSGGNDDDSVGIRNIRNSGSKGECYARPDVGIIGGAVIIGINIKAVPDMPANRLKSVVPASGDGCYRYIKANIRHAIIAWRVKAKC